MRPVHKPTTNTIDPSYSTSNSSTQLLPQRPDVIPIPAQPEGNILAHHQFLLALGRHQFADGHCFGDFEVFLGLGIVLGVGVDQVILRLLVEP